MNINILEVVEQEDGSAIVEMKLDNEAFVFFMSEGLNSVLRKVLNDLKEI
jgi:hypothetical protein